MALMIPDTIPSKASQGEKRLYKILQSELPDDCYVWYEPLVKGLYPDFIILGPTLGLLILEVKGWQPIKLLALITVAQARNENIYSLLEPILQGIR